MGIPETLQFIRLVDNISRAIDGLPNKIAAEAVNFSKARFREQAWVDTRSEPWKKRKSEGWGRKERPGRHILVDSGKLMRSIRKISASPSLVVIGTDVKYAKVHNEGGLISTTQRVRAYTRKRYSIDEVSKPGARKARYVKSQIGEVEVKAHTRKMNFRMPKRQFMGGSNYLNRGLERLITNEIVKATQESI